MKYRPPLRTSEIRAYNFGATARRLGFNLGSLIADSELEVIVPMGSDELAALDQLGPELFDRWAVKGWAEYRPSETVN